MAKKTKRMMMGGGVSANPYGSGNPSNDPARRPTRGGNPNHPNTNYMGPKGPGGRPPPSNPPPVVDNGRMYPLGMALGGPVPMASRLPSGKRGEAYKSAVSGKMANAESRMAGYESPDFKSARRSEYSANKMARRAGNAESRLSALGAKGYKKGGKVKRMAEGGLPEEASATTTSAPIGYGKGYEGPGMYKGPYGRDDSEFMGRGPRPPGPAPSGPSSNLPDMGIAKPPRASMSREEREAMREDRRENRDERREERRNKIRDRFEAFKSRRGGELGLKDYGQIASKLPADFMEKYGDRIGEFMSKRASNAPQVGGELPPATMKRGGRVKASAAPKRFAKGGLVKGAGCASRGVKKARIV